MAFSETQAAAIHFVEFSPIVSTVPSRSDFSLVEIRSCLLFSVYFPLRLTLTQGSFSCPDSPFACCPPVPCRTPRAQVTGTFSSPPSVVQYLPPPRKSYIFYSFISRSMLCRLLFLASDPLHLPKCRTHLEFFFLIKAELLFFHPVYRGPL